jgi:glucokinase
MLHLGVDVGGTCIKFGIVDRGGNIILREESRTCPERGSDAVVNSIIEGIAQVLARASLSQADLTSIGLGVPGTVDPTSGVVVYAPNLFWRNVEVVNTVRNAFMVPVLIAQDSRASAWAEYLVGAGKGLRSLATVTLGTGIGCGLVFDGKIFDGALGTAGEFGHQLLDMNGAPCNCGRRGCLEAYAGGLAIVREARKRIPDIHELVHKTPANINVQDVYDLAERGHLRARELTDSLVTFIGVGLVNMINLCSIELISISGGISNAADELLLNPLISFVRNREYKVIADRVRICRSELGEDAPLIGAALLYRHDPIYGEVGTRVNHM